MTLISGIAISRRAFDRAWRNRVVRNVAVLASGTVAAQAITMAFSPFITRIYGPEAFGLQGTFMAIVAVTTPLAALSYPIAIVLPRKDKEALSLVRLSVILSFVVALLASVFLVSGGDWLTATLGFESVAGYIFLIPVIMLFSAWTQIAHQWLIRKKQFGVIARTAVVQSLILNSAKTGIGWLHPLAVVLIVLATLGQGLYSGLLYFGARRRFRAELPDSEIGERIPMKEPAHRYSDFPFYRAPQNFINAASQSLPVFLLATLFGPAAAGFYALAKMVMGLPSTLIGKAVSDVFYPRITEAAYNGENLPRHIVQATCFLIAIGIVPFSLIVLFGPGLFSFVFGPAWETAGEYARWLALFFLFNFINKPSVAAAPVLGIQRGLLLYELFSTAAKVLGLVVGFYWLGSDVWAVALFSIIGVLAYFAMMLWILYHARQWVIDD